MGRSFRAAWILCAVAVVFGTQELAFARQATPEEAAVIRKVGKLTNADKAMILASHVVVRDLPDGGVLKVVKFVTKTPSGDFAVGQFALDEVGALDPDNGVSRLKSAKLSEWNQRGRLTRRLARLVAHRGGNDSFEVDMVLAIPHVLVDKENAILAWQHAAAHTLAVANARAIALARLEAVGIPAVKVSGHGPMLSFSATRSQLDILKHESGLGRIGVGSRKTIDMGTSRVWADSVKGASSTTGFDGDGVKVCLLESTYPSPDNMSNLSFAEARTTPPAQQTGIGGHTGLMGSHIASSDATVPGMASGVELYLGSWAGEPGPWHDALDWCVTKSTTVWNFSRAPDEMTDPSNPPDEPMMIHQYMDYLALQSPYPLIVAAAGNYGNTKYVQNMLQNGLVVGGSVDTSQSTPIGVYNCNWYSPNTDRSTHRFWTDEQPPFGGAPWGSNSINPAAPGGSPHGDWELPHLVAVAVSFVGNCLETGNGKYAGATSSATAITTAAGAQVQESNAALKSWPEATRAILLATATEDVDGTNLSLTDSVDDKDGVGELDVLRATTLANSANRVTAPSASSPVALGYNYSTVNPQSSTEFPSNIWTQSHFLQRASNTEIRVAMAWDSMAASCDPDPGVGSCDGGYSDLTADFDLHVFDVTTNSYVAGSTSYDNSIEMVDFLAVSGHLYRFDVYRFSPNTSTAYIAIAYGPR